MLTVVYPLLMCVVFVLVLCDDFGDYLPLIDVKRAGAVSTKEMLGHACQV